MCLCFLIYIHSCYSGCKKCDIPTHESGGIPTPETETESGERKPLIPKTGGKHCSLNKAKTLLPFLPWREGLERGGMRRTSYKEEREGSGGEWGSWETREGRQKYRRRERRNGN